MHATGPIAIASIQVASTANSIHRGYSSVAWASPTHGGRWLAQTNYDALMTHHTTENTWKDGSLYLNGSWGLYYVCLRSHSATPKTMREDIILPLRENVIYVISSLIGYYKCDVFSHKLRCFTAWSNKKHRKCSLLLACTQRTVATQDIPPRLIL